MQIITTLPDEIIELVTVPVMKGHDEIVKGRKDNVRSDDQRNDHGDEMYRDGKGENVREGRILSPADDSRRGRWPRANKAFTLATRPYGRVQSGSAFWEG